MDGTQVESTGRQSLRKTFDTIEKIIVQPPYYNLYRMAAQVCVLCISSFYFGYALVYPSAFNNTVLSAVYGPQSTTTQMGAVLVGVVPIGAIGGAGLAPIMIQFLSRKNIILVLNIVAVGVSVLIQYNNLIMLIVCRVIQGFLTGSYMAIIPIYIKQIVPKEIAGKYGVTTSIFSVLGSAVTFALGLILNAGNVQAFVFYRVITLFDSVLIIFQSVLLLFSFIPESPTSLIAKNKLDEARDVISQFYKPQFAERMLQQRVCDYQRTQAAKLQNNDEVAIKYSWKAYFLGFQMPFMQQMTGVNAVVAEAGIIVGDLSSGLALYAPLIVNIVISVAGIGTILMLGKYGRRPLLLIGNLALTIVNILIGILFVFSYWSPAGILIVILLIIFMLIYGLTVGPVVRFYLPQILPAKVVSFATMTTWVGCAICIIFTPIVIDRAGSGYPVFFFLGGITGIFFIINYWLMIETSGLTAVQVVQKFNKQQ